MLAADPLQLETNPFVAGASGARIGRPVQAAFGEVIRQIGLETPVVVVSGGAGTGKTLLMNMIASLAFFNAAFDGAPQIGAKHVADAVASQIPSPAPALPAAVLHPALRPADAEPAPAWDPPLRSEPLIAEARGEFSAQPSSVLW